MNSFLRVWPYVWPYRYRLLVSIFFGWLVAVFWGLNLTAAYPIVKVLLQGQSLAVYVDEEIVKAETELKQHNDELKRVEQRLAKFEEKENTTDEVVKLLQEQSTEQSKISTASSSLWMMNYAKSYIIPWLPEDQFDTFAVLLSILLFATMIKVAFLYIQDILVGSVVELTIMGIRKRCFRNALALDYQTLHMKGTAELMSRFTYDMSVLSNGLNLLGGKVIREPLKAMTCLFLAFCVSWQLTTLSLLMMPIAGFIFYRIGRKLKQASHRLMDVMSRIYKTLEETFSSLKIVIAFNGARLHRKQFHEENKLYFAKSMKLLRIDSLTSPLTEVLGYLAACMALLPGAYLVLRNTTQIWDIPLATHPMDIAKLSLLYVLLAGILDPARKLTRLFTKVKRASAAADRIFTLIDSEPLIHEPDQPKSLPVKFNLIDFRNVSFTYATRQNDGTPRPAALDHATATVRAGEVIAVVGENGSGKSTLVNLLPRFYDPNDGNVLIDGLDIREVRQRELRNRIGVVTQETFLLDTTIEENIRYGRPSSSRTDILKAAEQAHVSAFLDQLPDGIHTAVGQKGQKLSGGQRQRIALARAILRDPDILILDEATSAIDSQSERLIHQTLREFVNGRTTFIITHVVNQSILELITRTIVMENGRIIASGSHDELLEACAIYRKLFQQQATEKKAA